MVEDSDPEYPPTTSAVAFCLNRMEPPSLDVSAFCGAIHNSIRCLLSDPDHNPWEADSYEEAAKRSDHRIRELKRCHERIKVLQEREAAAMSVVVQHLIELEHFCPFLPRGSDGRRSDLPPAGPLPCDNNTPSSTVVDLGNGLATLTITSQRHRAVVAQNGAGSADPYGSYAEARNAPPTYEASMREILCRMTESPGPLSSSGSEDESPLPGTPPRSEPLGRDPNGSSGPSSCPGHHRRRSPTIPSAPTYGEALNWIDGQVGSADWWSTIHQAFTKHKSLRGKEAKVRVNQMLIFGTEKEVIDAIIWCGETRKEAEMRHLSFDPLEE